MYDLKETVHCVVIPDLIIVAFSRFCKRANFVEEKAKSPSEAVNGPLEAPVKDEAK